MFLFTFQMMKIDMQYNVVGWAVSEIHIFTSIELWICCFPENCTNLTVEFHLFTLGGATVRHSSLFFNGYQLSFMSFGQIPTFALNKWVKIRYLLGLAQNLSLELRKSENFKSGIFLHLITQLLSIQKFFPLSTHQVKKLDSSS